MESLLWVLGQECELANDAVLKPKQPIQFNIDIKYVINILSNKSNATTNVTLIEVLLHL